MLLRCFYFLILPRFLPQAPTPFARHPAKGQQRGALRRFDSMFGRRPSTASAAMPPGSPVNVVPASQSSPVSPQYSPASQPSLNRSRTGCLIAGVHAVFWRGRNCIIVFVLSKSFACILIFPREDSEDVTVAREDTSQV